MIRRLFAPLAPVWRLWSVSYYQARIALVRDPMHRHMPHFIQRLNQARSAS